MQIQADKIVDVLLAKLPAPSEAVFEVTMRDLVVAIARRLGENALMLTPSDLLLARDEVQAAFGHHMDEREFIDMGLDAWEIIRNDEVT